MRSGRRRARRGPPASSAPGGSREGSSWEGSTLEVVVGDVGHGGFCVARHDGRVVFVRHCLPGERVRALVTEDRGGSYCRADAVRVLEPAAARVEPPCPASGPGGCGGCDFQHVEIAAQRELKARVIAEQLRRIGGLDQEDLRAAGIELRVEELPGGPLGWRSRTRLTVDGAGRAGFRAHRSHTVIPVEHCPLALPGSLDGVLADRWRPGSELEVVADDEGGVHVADRRPGRPARQAEGSGRVVRHAAGRRWELRGPGFWQVHPAAADALAGIVGRCSAAPPGGHAWDLYGGVGLFAAVLAGQVGREGSVSVVESDARAVLDGSAALADLPQVRFVTGRVERVLDRLPHDPDVVVLDPPRAGAGKAVVAAVARRGPGRIVHVACDPAALARDLAAYTAAGYRLVALRALDSFPMTHHVECVALLRAPGGTNERPGTDVDSAVSDHLAP